MKTMKVAALISFQENVTYAIFGKLIYKAPLN